MNQIVESATANQLKFNEFGGDSYTRLMLGADPSISHEDAGSEYVVQPKIIRDKEFAQRLAKACDGNPNVPLHNHGRLRWVQEQMKARGATVSLETVRKWFAGEVKARPDKLALLAQVLEVDAIWLAMGQASDLSPREMRARNATADGAVNVLTGFIQIAGGNPAFPRDDDQRARDAHIHLYAIIRGAQYAFHVSLAREDGDHYRFQVPSTYAEVFVVGAIPTESPGVRFIELPAELIAEQGVRRGGGFEVSIPASEAEKYKIRTFGERF